ncbi:MAG: T3SS effector HopA1 family protein [Pseudomonadota bacterium]
MSLFGKKRVNENIKIDVVPPNMSNRLRQTLDLCWSSRINNGAGKNRYTVSESNIYRIYTRSMRTANHAPGAVSAFLRELIRIDQPFEVQCAVSHDRHGRRVQKEDWLGAELRARLGAFCYEHSGFARIEGDSLGRLNDLLQEGGHAEFWEMLSGSFFHFRPLRVRTPRGGQDCRLYLNVGRLYRATVMNWIIQNIFTIPTCTDTKVSGPGYFERADSIVLYFSNKAGRDLAIQRLEAYQQIKNVTQGATARYFNDGVPRMVRPVNDMRGIGMADEPVVDVHDTGKGALVLRNRSTSFGSYRAALIYHALLQTLRTRGTKRDFILRVAKYFEAGGVDISRPDQNANTEKLIAAVRTLEDRIKKGQKGKQLKVPEDALITL